MFIWHHLYRRFVYQLLILLLLAGCGPRIGGGETALHVAQSPLLVDLPALYIDYDQDGHASIGQVPVAALADLFPVDPTRLNLTPAQIKLIVDANIQHLQVTNTPERLLLLINGKPMPSLFWGTPASVATTDTQPQQAAMAPLATLLPMVSAMGVGVVIRFPVSTGMAPIPLTPVTVDSSAAQAVQAEYLALIGEAPHLSIDVFYHADGSWTVADLDATAWQAALPLPWARLNLRTEQIEELRAGGINELILKSDREGLFVHVNGQPLPHLSWANGELNQLLLLAADGGLFRQLLGDTPTAYSLAVTLERLLPMLQVTEIELHVHFAPTATE